MQARLVAFMAVVLAVAVLGVAGPWMLTTLVDYLRSVLLSIPAAVG